MTYVKYTWGDIETAITSIQVSMHSKMWMPDYVVGYCAGGAVPAVMLASRLEVPFYHLDKDESNCWMSEDASGYNDDKDKKKILVVTDFNRNSDDLNWIKRDWIGSIHANPWDDVWHKNVRFAAILDNINSDFETDFNWREVAQSHSEILQRYDVDFVFPWEGRAALGRLG